MGLADRGDERLSAWRRPGREERGARQYIDTVRERLRFIIGAVVVATAVAVAYVAVTPKVYEAESDMLVTPVASGDQNDTLGLPLITESSDPTRDVETASRLVASREVAGRVIRRLRLDTTPTDLLKDVEVAPVAQSNIVSITAKADSAKLAADTANAFGEEVIRERTSQLHEQIDRILGRLRQQVATAVQDGDQSTGPDSLRAQLTRLETLRAQDDPTLRLETRADPPDQASAPRPVLSVAAGILVGLAVGLGGAFVTTALDPRLRREDQLRSQFALPILTRIPYEKQAKKSVRDDKGEKRLGFRLKRRRALGPRDLSPPTHEAYRALRSLLAARRDGHEGGSIMVTGASPAEGKTTTAVNLATSFALAGNRVILMEADFRRPTVGEVLGIRGSPGFGRVLLGNMPLEQALKPVKPFGENLRVLLVGRNDQYLADLFSLTAATKLLAEARQLADIVVIDSPPLTEVVDTLPLARAVDDVVIVVRLGNTKLTQLERLGDLLEQNGITPAGFAVVGVGDSDEDSYYLAARKERSLFAEPGEEETQRAPSL